MTFETWRRLFRARLFLLLRRPQLAAQEYREALALDPASVTAANGLALRYAAEKRHAEAEDLFRRSLAAKTEQPYIWYNLGFLCDQQGRHEDAVAAFTRAVELGPKLDQAWYGLGHAHAALGRHQEAAAALEKAGALVPENGFVWYSLGMAYHHLGETERVTGIAKHLNRFDRRMTLQLIRDAGRSDLEYLIADYNPYFR